MKVVRFMHDYNVRQEALRPISLAAIIMRRIILGP